MKINEIVYKSDKMRFSSNEGKLFIENDEGKKDIIISNFIDSNKDCSFF